MRKQTDESKLSSKKKIKTVDKRIHPHTWLVLIIILCMLLAVSGTVFINLREKNKAHQLSSTNVSLAAKIVATKSDIHTLSDLNSGTVNVPKSVLPANQIGLAANQVLFTLPKGWQQAPLKDNASQCGGGTVFAKPLCDDIMTLLPSTLVDSESTTHYETSPFTVNIAVYAHTDSTSAKDWLSSDYGETISDWGNPAAINQSGAPINGYDGFTFTSQYTDTPYPTSVYYAIVHGKYAVVVTSTYMLTVNPSGGTSGADVNEDYSQYLPDIQAIVDSITFKGN